MDGDGLQVSMSVTAPAGCPAGEVSAQSDAPVESIMWSGASEGGAVTEEFTTEASVASGDAEEIFETGNRTRYRFSRERDTECVCEAVERQGCPLADVRAENGQLYLTFYAPDVDAVRSLVEDVREEYGGVHLEQLSRAGDLDSDNLILVDRNRLTDRQREVLELAYERGYFQHPRETNASELAAELDISLSTFTEHLAIAQSKVLDALVDSA